MYPGALWKVDTDRKELFLTFDDGPVPGITEWVLDTLKEYDAKATFFCVGANVEKHPSVFQRILAEGHTAGNHSMHHIKGFSRDLDDYMEDVNRCRNTVPGSLFRPPYGQLKRGQFRELKKQGYNVVFWDVISYDYESIKPEKCLQKVMNNAVKGSIILFHDSYKAEKNLKFVLPLILKHFANLQFSFKALTN
jgi:peptidoglycan/xylan/chitin deacetylase (PgdA/CDA1 family)